MNESSLDEHSTMESELNGFKEWMTMMRDRYQSLKHPNLQLDDAVRNSHGASWVRDRLLGEGDFGLVFLAKSKPHIGNNNNNNDLPSVFALKSAYMNKDQYCPLKQEKGVLCRLRSNPLVLQCYGDEVTETCDGKKLYNILMEYCSGGSLEDYIEKSKKGLPESEIKTYTRDILEGLQYIHSQGYVHCDIKPSNILLAPKNNGRLVAKIADFGLAKEIYTDPNFAYKGIADDIREVGDVVLKMMCGNLECGIGEANELINISKHGRDFLEKYCLQIHEVDHYHELSAENLLKHPFLLDCSS